MQIPSSDAIQLQLAGKVSPSGILLLQAMASAQRAGKRCTAKWFMNRLAIARSWYFELKRTLILAGYLDEDGRIYLDEFDMMTIARRVYAAAKRRVQPRMGTVERTRMNLSSITMADMVEKWGPEFANLPDRGGLTVTENQKSGINRLG